MAILYLHEGVAERKPWQRLLELLLKRLNFPNLVGGCGVCVGFGSSAGLIYVVNVSCLDWDTNDEYES